ncbi:uncharacterized protein LOC124857176 isoform X2 [Girardinichthys multiradiatus]|uniref:uncharacterized protein LOC124857176 isoform X2 n=1 Tax=Girardinichthys multiradiatus TaxID=208333 RepID=UPI001FAC1321|nr:uncharacterized protein LOC124857176 isoform X2 [Girardinichthys multiradiatus]
MTFMVSGVWVRVLCIFCLVVVPRVWADYCTSYYDSDNQLHVSEKCDKYCCGGCSKKYCCKNKNDRLTTEEQNNCPTRKRPNQRRIVVTDTVVNMPQPSYSPSGYQAPPAGYQTVPGHWGSSLPTAPPPSYMESIAPSHLPATFLPGQPMYTLTPSNQPHSPPLLIDEVAQHPYNPSYVLQT